MQSKKTLKHYTDESHGIKKQHRKAAALCKRKPLSNFVSKKIDSPQIIFGGSLTHLRDQHSVLKIFANSEVDVDCCFYYDSNHAYFVILF